MIRAAIYARYSSDMQDVSSIADQVATARTFLSRQGWHEVGTFEDAAISGASTVGRPGLANLMAAAEAGQFDVVLTEAIDRLSRDQEDIARIYKRLTYWNVELWTLADGRVSELHVGLKGTMAALFLADLAQKTRRGQLGRVKLGRIPGGRCYGYDVIRDGEERGVRRINDAEAAVVRRIYSDYVAGVSPKRIVTALNLERIAGPSGGAWNVSTLVGSAKRQNGVLNNELYRGVLVFNRQRFVKDPITGKRQARANPPEDWVRQPVPELAIVEDDLWEAAQRLRRDRSPGTHPRVQRRPKRLLSGLIRCGACGAKMIVRSGAFLGCSARANRGTCDNVRQISVSEVETRVLVALERHLLDPAVAEEAVATYVAERRKLAAEARKSAQSIDRELAGIKARIERLLDMVETGVVDPREGAERLNRLAVKRDELTALKDASAPSDVVAIHPHAAQRYRKIVTELRLALAAGDQEIAAAISGIRNLIDKIVIEPAPKGVPCPIKLVGDLATLMDGNEATATQMVAGVGFEPTTFRL